SCTRRIVTATIFASTIEATITTAAMVARSQKGIDPLFDAGHGDSSDGPAAREAVVVSVPEPDLVLAQPPTEQHVFPLANRGEVDQARVEVLHHHAEGMD